MKKCECCGKEFEGKRKESRFCSGKCQNLYYNRKRPSKSKRQANIKCMICGKEVTGKRVFYCSDTCLKKSIGNRMKRNREERKSPYNLPKIIKLIKCNKCGKPFNSEHKGNRQCPKCYEINNKIYAYAEGM
jgi:predicted nucleic acid-binding Zn ribbon protein